MKRFIALMIASVLILSLGPTTVVGSDQTSEPESPEMRPMAIFIETSPNMAGVVKERLLQLGGAVKAANDAFNFVAGQIPGNQLETLNSSLGVVAVLPDTTFSTPEREYNGNDVTSQERMGMNEVLKGLEPSDLVLTRRVIGADTFSKTMDVDGRGVVVAVIDGGVDPTQPDLQFTTDAKEKIIEWRSFVEESRIDTREVANVTAGALRTKDGVSLSVGSIRSLSGKLHYGFITDKQVEALSEGKASGKVAIVVADSTLAGVYDLAYVDTNRDLSFSDEVPLIPSPNKATKITLQLHDKGNQANVRLLEDVVVPGVSTDASEVYVERISDHGTKVARVLAGNGGASGVTGVAPGAQIMALKALSVAGSGQMSDIVEAVAYAAEHGASVINMSLGSYRPDQSDAGVIARALADAQKKYGVIPVVAAGNDGPGLSSVGTPGDDRNVISAGSMASVDMLREIFGVTVPYEIVLPYSSRGPRRDGEDAVTVLAPDLGGTSFASPHTAGAVALLLQASRQNGVVTSFQTVRHAIQTAARPLRGYASEQETTGVLDLPGAWQALKELGASPVAITVDDGAVSGVYAPANEDGRVPLKVTNHGQKTLSLNLKTTAKWLSLDRTLLRVAPNQTRSVEIQYDPPETPGAYIAFVQGDDPLTPGTDFESRQTVVVPDEFTAQNHSIIERDVTLGPGEYSRHFLRVEPGTGWMTIDLSVLRSASGIYDGRARAMIYGPDDTVYGIPFRGLSSDASPEPIFIRSPKPGTWEVDVISAMTLSRLGVEQTKARLTAAAYGIFPDAPSVEINLLRGITPPTTLTGEVQFRSRYPGFSSRAIGLGVANLGLVAPPQRVTVVEEEDTVHYFDVADRQMHLQVKATEVGGKDSIVGMWLFRIDFGRWSWVYVDGAVSSSGVEGVALEIDSPPPGRYALILAGGRVTNKRAPFDLSITTWSGGTQVSLDNRQVYRAANEQWTVAFSMTAPPTAGRYLAQVAIFDEDDKYVVTSVPVHINYVSTLVRAEVSPKVLIAGQPTTLTISLRDVQTHLPVDSPLRINGRKYYTRGGSVTIPVKPEMSTLRLNLEVLAPDTGLQNPRLELNVLPTKPSLPAQNAPDEVQRQRVEDLLGILD